MNTFRAMNDNIPQEDDRNNQRIHFSWKLEYFPRTEPTLVGAKTSRQQESRPLRVLMIKLEDEI